MLPSGFKSDGKGRKYCRFNSSSQVYCVDISSFSETAHHLVFRTITHKNKIKITKHCVINK